MNINLLSDAQIEQFRDIISQATNIVLCCHESPDGDAIGSMIGWDDFLRGMGKKTMIVVPNAFPDFLKWVPGGERIVRYDKHKEMVEDCMQKADLIFCMDFNSTKRVLDLQPALDGAKASKILIDHHIGPELDALMSFSFPKMSSTCEIVFRMIWQLGGYEKMTRKSTIPLYMGMMTDTGGFTYNSNNPEIFYVISLLLEKGKFDKDKIYRNVYNNYSEWCIRMRGYVMNQKLRVIEGSHACYYTLTKEEMRKFHFIKGDAEGLVNEPLRIKGMRLSISLREDTEKDNVIWVSLRSVDHYYCNVLAEMFFNGGGHENAAGGRVVGTMEDAEQIVHRAILYFAAHDGVVQK